MLPRHVDSTLFEDDRSRDGYAEAFFDARHDDVRG
jgi:hypothetical protein